MDALCAAIPVARALLRAADTVASHTLTVAAGRQRATLHIAHGQLWDIDGVDDEPLGDALLSSGALDMERYRVALEQHAPRGRVGLWLISVGAASESSVRAALSGQLERRVESVLRWRGAELVLARAGAAASCSVLRPASQTARANAALQVSAPLASSVYAGLVRIAAELPPDVLRARAGDGMLRLTTLGQWLAPKLAPAAAPAATLLAAHAAREHWPARAALRAIGALVERNAELDGYSLLLRKRRELARHASARRLLDLPEGARPEQARLAFRKLAQKLHPDRFHATQPGLTDLSNKVMCALVSAEAELSAQITRKRVQR